MLNKDKVIKQLAKKLRQLREDKDISQEDLAFKAGLGRSYYWRVEKGEINLTIDTLIKLCNVLEVEIIDLFQRTRTKNR